MLSLLRAAWRRLRRLFYAARIADDLRARQEGWNQFELSASDIAWLEAATRERSVDEPLPVAVRCPTCWKTLRHYPPLCPLFPDPPPARLHKWARCACTVHTCYDRMARGAPVV